MHASQLSVSLLQFTNPFGILTILAFSLFVNNSEKIELWVPLMGPLLRYLGPLLVPFLLKVGSPLGPLFRIFGSPFDFVTVHMAKFKTVNAFLQVGGKFTIPNTRGQSRPKEAGCGYPDGNRRDGWRVICTSETKFVVKILPH